MEKSDGSKPEPQIPFKKADPRKTGDYYLTDDGALIRFLSVVERNQPPSLYQRLLNADVQKSGNLSKSQFTGILKDLNLTPQDVMSLQRIAGYSTASKNIEIDEFVKVIKERGKIRQEIEIDTFKKIQKAIRKEGWTLKDTFEVFDIDQNKYVDYQEMIDGFKKLKINIPPKHLKSVFAILDEDGNGQISLPEFKSKLDFKSEPAEASKPLDDIDEAEDDREDYYAKKEAEKKAKEEEEKKKSKLKQQEIDKYADSLREGTKKNEKDPIKRRQEEEIKLKIDQDDKAKYEKELVNGQLKINIGKGFNINDVRTKGWKFFYLQLSLEGANENESFTSKPIAFYENNSFKFSAIIPMIKAHPKDFADEFNTKIYASKDSFENSSFVGEVYWNWKSALTAPNEYAIANKYELTDKNNDSAFGKVKGRVMVNVKFIPAGEKDSKFTKDGQGKEELKDAKNRSDKPGNKGAVSKLGDLKVEVISGKGFEPFMTHVIFFRLKETKVKERTRAFTENSDPEIKESLLLPLYKRETQDVPKLLVQDVNNDSEDIITTLEIDFSKLVNTTTHHMLKEKWYQFEGDESKEIMLRLTFISAGDKAKEAIKEKPIGKVERPVPTSSGNFPKPTDYEVEDFDGDKNMDKAPTPKMKQFKFDDAAVPDPKDTNRFADEFPSEEGSVHGSELELNSNDPPQTEEFRLGDGGDNVSIASGDFEN